MDVTVNVYHHFDLASPLAARISTQLTAIQQQLATLINQETQIMASLDTLTSQVAATNTAEASAIVLINGLAAQLAAAGTDPVALAALADSLKTNSDALAAAVVANTPHA